MAEVHVIGEIIGGSQFHEKTICCRWKLQSGENWQVLEGASQGQTQLDSPHVGGISRWNHPLDLHLATRGLSGWPHLQLQIYHLDDYSRVHLAGYASVDLPTRPGVHSIDVPAWRPLGTFSEELARYFVGGGIELPDWNAVSGGGSDRLHLRTTPAGVVHLEVGVIFRDFRQFGVEY